MASFLSSFFKPKWQHQDATVRLEAISQELKASELIQIAKNDTNNDVRIKAIRSIFDPTKLTGFFSEKNAEIKQTAVKQYILICTGCENLTDQINSLNKIKSNHANATEVLLTIASESHDLELVQAAIDLIHDETSLFEFIKTSHSAKARLKAVEKITIFSMLKEIESTFKGKDKNLHRYAKNAIQTHKDAEFKLNSAKQHVQELLKQADDLSNHAFSPTYEGQLARLKQSWLQADFTQDSDNTFSRSIEICEKILEENKQKIATEKAKIELEKEAKLKHYAAISNIEDLVKAYKEKGVSSEVEVFNNIQNIQTIWSEAESIFPATNTLKQDFETELSTLFNIHSSLKQLDKSKAITDKTNAKIDEKIQQSRTIKKILNSINWPNDIPTPAILSKLRELNDELDSAISATKDHEDDNIASITHNLDSLEKSIEEGRFKQATKLQTIIKNALFLIEKNKAKSLQSRFQRLSNELNNLNDWKGFAAKPKFIELCDKMESLIDSSLNPKELINAIQTLQNQWKALGSLGDKKEHNLLWNRFKSASDKAYIPCQEYYDNLANIRAFNLEQRKIICEQLETLYINQDWDNANWKALQKIVDKAFQEYKKFAPVERNVNNDIQKKFNEATKKIKQKLQGYYQSNVSAKKDLIEQCSQLLDLENILDAIEQCKALQTQWKNIESTGKSEQALWNEFREKCDAIFARRNEENNAKKSLTNSLIASAKNIVEQAQALTNENTNDAIKQIELLKADIHQLAIPDKVKTTQLQSLNNIQSKIKSNINDSQQSQMAQRWVTARTLASNIAQWEQINSDDHQGIQKEIENADIPLQAKNIFMQRLQNKPETHLHTLKAHCLDFEIAMGLDSPEEDLSERMTIQIKRLQENMGKKQPSRSETIETAQLNWFGFSADSQLFFEYESRFYHAIKQSTETSMSQ